MTIGEFLSMPWHQGWNPLPDTEWMASVADRWASFPVDREPRPIVLVAEPEQVPGFATDDAKIAWINGRAVAPTQPSDDAVSFATDRGPRSMPCLLVAAAGSLGPIRRADLSKVDVWSPPGRPHDEHWYSDALAIEDPADTHALTWRFSGSPQVYTDYPDAEVLETAAAVVVVPRPVERPGSDARRAVAASREITTRLHRPIGSRVVLDVYGRAAVVNQPS